MQVFPNWATQLPRLVLPIAHAANVAGWARRALTAPVRSARRVLPLADERRTPGAMTSSQLVNEGPQASVPASANVVQGGVERRHWHAKFVEYGARGALAKEALGATCGQPRILPTAPCRTGILTYAARFAIMPPALWRCCRSRRMHGPEHCRHCAARQGGF